MFQSPFTGAITALMGFLMFLIGLSLCSCIIRAKASTRTNYLQTQKILDDYLHIAKDANGKQFKHLEGLKVFRNENVDVSSVQLNSRSIPNGLLVGA